MLLDLNENDPKVRSDDCILVIKPIEGKPVKSSTGLIDNRIFTEGNNLRVVRVGDTSLWTFKYSKGALPPVLQGQRFTSFNSAKSYAQNYLNKRNLEIVNVVNA